MRPGGKTSPNELRLLVDVIATARTRDETVARLIVLIDSEEPYTDEEVHELYSLLPEPSGRWDWRVL